MILTDTQYGLSKKELISAEKNSIHIHHGSSLLIMRILYGQITSIFFILIFVAACISFFLHELKDAAILFSINIINVGLGFFQEYKASKAAEKLQSLVTTTSRVIREGILINIHSDELAFGDIIKLVGGDVIPVDIYVRKVENAYIDESIRTGETKPLEVIQGATLYSGSSVVIGEITGQVIAVGNKASLALYNKHLATIKKQTSFELFVQKITFWVFIITALCTVITGVLSVIIFKVQSIKEFVLFAISLIVGIVPESLPLIVTLILTNAALLLSKQKVIVKRLASLQELGSTAFLLTDKTGTLTENNIKVSVVKDFHNLKETVSIIAYAQYERSPMDSVFDGAIKKHFLHTHHHVSIKNFIPFNNKAGFSQFETDHGTIIRGQFHKIIEQCTHKPHTIKKQYEDLEKLGLRILAFATKLHHGGFTLNGLIAFEDPLKFGTQDIVIEAEKNQVDIKVLTGDSAPVATYIAHKLSLISNNKQIVSLEDKPIKHMSRQFLLDTQVFAKCKPEDKLLLIERYNQYGSVAFLGEGINDALALKKANVGMVVSNSSDVARQSADILLTEKSLTPILKGIYMGRKAFYNITTYLVCTLSGNAGTMFSLIIILFVWKAVPLLPIHILLNNLLTDIPLFLLVYDTVAKELIHKRPTITESYMIKKLFIFALVSTLFDMLFFLAFFGGDINELRSSWFVFGVWSELIFILSVRSDTVIWKSPKLGFPLLWAIITISIVTLMFTQIPILANLFSLQALNMQLIYSIIGLTFLRLIADEIVKVIFFNAKLKH